MLRSLYEGYQKLSWTSSDLLSNRTVIVANIIDDRYGNWRELTDLQLPNHRV